MKLSHSQRFQSSIITRKLVPDLLVMILVGLLGVLVLTGLVVLGFMPGA